MSSESDFPKNFLRRSASARIKVGASNRGDKGFKRVGTSPLKYAPIPKDFDESCITLHKRFDDRI